MSVLVPNLWNIPFCDFGIGTIDGGLRGLVAYVISREYGCGYCAAHCAALGTIWRGDSVFLAKNIKAMAPEPDPEVFTPKELSAINISKKLGPVPSRVTADDIRDMASVYTEKEQEGVINSGVVMGFLNRFMDTIGMTLEMEPLEMGMEQLAPTGWEHGHSYDPEADAELMAEDRVEAVKRAERKSKSNFLSYIKMIIGAKLADRASLKNTPTAEQLVAQKCMELAGFVPYYLVQMKHSQARNAFVWAFTLRLCQGSEEVPAQLKQLMCYICATNAGNTILRAHYAFMAHRNGMPIRQLATATNTDSSEAVAADDTIDAKQVAAMALAEACSGTPSTVSPVLVGLLMRQYSPAGVIELIATVSLAFMYHRWTAIYMPREYEPEVLKFVQEHGAALGIDPERPCTKDQSTWEGIAKEARAAAGLG
ncbi:probable fusion protein [Ectocarpus siliculosus]|uniref:Probable fusion protein n=1 Tax=Ectocarpus siliculosus TaxID=2880 RepID=D7FMN7_ECTSI|nr:probable fusion protein [Ectocarpus siliculosus]|eukprot:CBJ25934.1 probable fusion protein [Ectocarpus siliculosus]